MGSKESKFKHNGDELDKIIEQAKLIANSSFDDKVVGSLGLIQMIQDSIAQSIADTQGWITTASKKIQKGHAAILKEYSATLDETMEFSKEVLALCKTYDIQLHLLKASRTLLMKKRFLDAKTILDVLSPEALKKTVSAQRIIELSQKYFNLIELMAAHKELIDKEGAVRRRKFLKFVGLAVVSGIALIGCFVLIGVSFGVAAVPAAVALPAVASVPVAAQGTIGAGIVGAGAAGMNLIATSALAKQLGDMKDTLIELKQSYEMCAVELGSTRERLGKISNAFSSIRSINDSFVTLSSNEVVMTFIEEEQLEEAFTLVQTLTSKTSDLKKQVENHKENYIQKLFALQMKLTFQ